MDLSCVARFKNDFTGCAWALALAWMQVKITRLTANRLLKFFPATRTYCYVFFSHKENYINVLNKNQRPFVGTGTTLQVARQHGRDGIGTELSWVYLSGAARERLGLAALAAWQHGAPPKAERVDDLPLFALSQEDAPHG